MCVAICGRFCLNEGGVAGYVNWMKAKSPANWGVQITGMIFQTRSKEEKNMENKKAFGHALAIFTIFIQYNTTVGHTGIARLCLAQ